MNQRNPWLGFSLEHWRLLLLLFMLAFGWIWERNEFQKTEAEIRQTLKVARKLEEETLPLKLEDRFLNRLDRVETLAKRDLFMVETPQNHFKVIP